MVSAFSYIGRRANNFLANNFSANIIINYFFTIASVRRWFFAVRVKVHGRKKNVINNLILIEVFYIASVVLLVRPLSRHCSGKTVATNTMVGK